jgi:hypothetical protein
MEERTRLPFGRVNPALTKKDDFVLKVPPNPYSSDKLTVHVGSNSPIVRNVHKRQVRSGPKRKRGGLIFLILSVSRLPFFRAFFLTSSEGQRYVRFIKLEKANWNFSDTNIRVPNKESASSIIDSIVRKRHNCSGSPKNICRKQRTTESDLRKRRMKKITMRELDDILDGNQTHLGNCQDTP